MKIYFLFIACLPIFITSCSCERNANEEKFDEPAWVADKFYNAYSHKDFEEAAYYCDKHSKNSLESISYQSNYMEDVQFIKVDSCDLFEEHAYCYCRYKDSDSIEQVDKLLLRNYNEIWKVHFSKGGFNQNTETSILYRKKAEINNEAPEMIQNVADDELRILDSLLFSITSFINDVDIVIGFFEEDRLMSKEMLAYKVNSYDDYYTKKNHPDLLEAEYRYYFMDGILTKYEAILYDVKSRNIYGVFDYISHLLRKEYGDPYNMDKISSEDWYKYKEIKWFLKGYNEEIVLSVNNNEVTLLLREAY